MGKRSRTPCSRLTTPFAGAWECHLWRGPTASLRSRRNGQNISRRTGNFFTAATHLMARICLRLRAVVLRPRKLSTIGPPNPKTTITVRTRAVASAATTRKSSGATLSEWGALPHAAAELRCGFATTIRREILSADGPTEMTSSASPSAAAPGRIPR